MTKLTTKHVAAAFGVSPMTVYLWRQGTATRSKLRATVTGRAVSFAWNDVKAWASVHGVPMRVSDPAKLLGDPTLANAKSGPRPTSVELVGKATRTGKRKGGGDGKV